MKKGTPRGIHHCTLKEKQLQLLLKSLNTPADLLSQLRQSISLILKLYACSTSIILIASVQRS